MSMFSHFIHHLRGGRKFPKSRFQQIGDKFNYAYCANYQYKCFDFLRQLNKIDVIEKHSIATKSLKGRFWLDRNVPCGMTETFVGSVPRDGWHAEAGCHYAPLCDEHENTLIPRKARKQVISQMENGLYY